MAIAFQTSSRGLVGASRTTIPVRQRPHAHVALIPYVSIETYISRNDLTSPGYIVDAIAMVLLFVGAVHSLRAQPRCSVVPGVLLVFAVRLPLGWSSTRENVHTLPHD
ncbi:MAG: hypothetical protein GY711_31025 [bacterium]|nr:hypothetical protein [bacterium]